MLPLRSGLSLVALSIALAGCSKTQKEIFDAARPAADALRAKVVSAAGLVASAPRPAPGAVCKSSKKLTFDPGSDAHDTDFIMLEEAKRGAGAKADGQKDDDLDLHFGTAPLPWLLRGTHTQSIYPSYMTSDAASSEFVDTMRRAQSVKNLVVIRTQSTTVDYFLVDLAAPTIVCSGTFTAEADPKAGTRLEEYDRVTINKRSGKEVKREHVSETHDDYKSSLYSDAVLKLAQRMKAELGIDTPR